MIMRGLALLNGSPCRRHRRTDPPRATSRAGATGAGGNSTPVRRSRHAAAGLSEPARTWSNDGASSLLSDVSMIAAALVALSLIGDQPFLAHGQTITRHHHVGGWTVRVIS